MVAEIDRIRAAPRRASDYTYEIIAVDDCSTDGSNEVLRQVPGIRLITLPRNGGSGTARRIGSRRARRGDRVDRRRHDLPERADSPAREGASRLRPDRRRPHIGAGHDQGAAQAGASGASASSPGYLAQTDIPDLNSGLRAFRRDVADQYLHLLPAGFSCVTTITMTFLANGYSVKYVDIPYAKRAGKSKFHPIKDTRRYMLQVIRMVPLVRAPGGVFMPLGLVLGFLGLVKLGYDVALSDVKVAGNTLLIFFCSRSR